MREILQIVDIDGVLGRHDEPNLVVVEARIEGNLIRVVDIDCAIRPIDWRHVLTPNGADHPLEQRMAYVIGVYRVR